MTQYRGLDVHQATISAAVIRPYLPFLDYHSDPCCPRLRLRGYCCGHWNWPMLKRAQALFAHWEIVRYLRKIVPWPYPRVGAYIWYRDHALPAMERGEEWHWTLRLKDSPNRLIGAIGLMREENDNRGFWLGLPWQGQGLMTEACEAVTDYWFDVLKFTVLRAPKAVPNVASRRISENSACPDHFDRRA